MVLEFILPFSLILPGLWILQIARIKIHNRFEQISLSYILSLAVMFSLLYVGGIMKAFNLVSFIFLAMVFVFFVHLIALFIMKTLRSPHQFNTSFFLHVSAEKLVVVISAIGLLAIYTMFLSSKAILDSDVVQYYLPIAREIVRENGFTYNTGYDYNILLKPIGVSVLYAWIYVVNGSTLSEAFRLMPLVPILMLIVLNYAIATTTTKSKTVSLISTAIFLISPFQDRFLLYTSFYPDIFYYPLIFISIYILLEYFQSKRSSLLFWSGMAFGAASLLKAQTIYFLIAFMLVFVVLELRNFKKLSAAFCIFTPFYILVPRILADSILREGFRLTIVSLTGTQLELFLFLSMLSVSCYYLTMCRNIPRTITDKSTFKCFIKRIAFILIPFAVLSSLWYMNNLLRFGTLIWTSSIDLPNYDWALEILKSLKTAQPTANIWHYIVYFVFMFVDPAVMGYTMLIPLLIGLLFVLEKRLENFNVLLFFGIISSLIILSTVVISLNTSVAGYNPRDILPLAPLLTTLSAFGIVFTTSNFCKKGNDEKGTFVSLLLVAYFGFLSYIHSVLVWLTSLYHVTTIDELMSAFGNSVGLNLKQTSFQLSYRDRAIFVGENILRIVSLSLVAGIPVLALMICRHYKLFTRGYTIIVKFGTRPKKVVLKLHSRPCSSRQWLFVKSVFVISLMLSIMIIPRVEMLIVQGDLKEIKENQLKKNYRNLYELFASPSEFEGGILTFKAPMGLPYYLPSIKIIDLIYPANLAFLKDCFQSISLYEAVVKLRQKGISYLLINFAITKKLDASLNFTLSKIVQNPELASLSRTFGSWQLYNVGPNSVENISIPLSGWDMDPQYTNADYILSYDGISLLIELRATDTDSKITIVNRDLPKLALSSYYYITV